MPRLPVCQRGNRELVRGLERFDMTDNLRHESSILERVVNHRPYDALVINEKDTTDDRRRRLFGVDHTQFPGHFHGQISDDREWYCYTRLLFYIMHPGKVR